MEKFLFISNIERQMYFWKQASEKIRAGAYGVLCEGKLVQEATPWGKEWEKKLASVDIVLIRWMGTGLDCRFVRTLSEYMQHQQIRHLFLVEDAGDDLLQYGIKPEEEHCIRQYFSYGGVDNIVQCILWVHNQFNGAEHVYLSPKLLPWHGIYHPKAETMFQDAAEYKKYYSSLTERYDKAKARLEEVNRAISDKQTRLATIEAFLDEVKRLDGVTEFQPTLWYGLADHMTVYSKDDVRVRFKDGTEIRACCLK